MRRFEPFTTYAGVTVRFADERWAPEAASCAVEIVRTDEYVRAAVSEAALRAYLAGHNEGYRDGYKVGRAHGELIGLEMGGDWPAPIKARQLH